jgi:hypothetical protein
MKPKHPNELLEMVVEHGVIHTLIDIIECLGDDRVAGEDIQRNTRGCEESRWMHPQSTKVTDHKATQFVRCCQRETRNGILWVYFESDAIF